MATLALLFLMVGCAEKEGSSILKICQNIVGSGDISSCEQQVEMLRKNTKISDDDLETVARFVANPSSYNPQDKEVSLVVSLILKALESFRDGATAACTNMEKVQNLQAGIDVNSCIDRLKNSCDNNDLFSISACASTQVFCDEFYFASIGVQCRTTTDALFLTLIETKQAKLCKFAAKKQLFTSGTTQASCTSALTAAGCDDDDIFSLNSCLESNQFCSSFFTDRVGNACMSAAQGAISFTIQTKELNFCTSAAKKGLLKSGITAQSCTTALTGKCDENDLFSLSSCLGSNQFCSDFFLNQVSVACMNAVNNTVTLPS